SLSFLSGAHMSISHLGANATLDFTLPKQRTESGIKYERFVSNIRSAITSKAKDPAVKAAQDEVLAVRDLKPGSVQASTVLSEMSVMYANDEYIGTRLMPLNDVGKRTAEFYQYNKRDRFAYPDDEMEVRAEALEVSEGRTRTSVALQGRALKEFVDQTILNVQDAPLNEMMDAQANVLEGLSLKQEQRIATVAGVAGSYGAKTVAISAADRGDRPSVGAPVNDINAA